MHMFAVLSLFTYVQFNNQECVGATGDNGTCVTASECAQKGGTSNGPCAGGFGTCCICEYIHTNVINFTVRHSPLMCTYFTVYSNFCSCNSLILFLFRHGAVLTSCGTTVRENGTYFVNNGYPNQYSGTGSCQINIVKANANVCQYR